MSDTFLPGSGFDTYEQQDKVLVGLCGGTGCKAAVRILQQQGFAVMGAVVRLCTDVAPLWMPPRKPPRLWASSASP